MMCDPKLLCGKDGDTSCESFAACRQRVARVVDTNGLDRPFTSDGDIQKNVFISQHFEILNATTSDRSISQLQALLGLIKLIPKPLMILFTICASMFALMAIIPAIVICVRVLSNKVAIAKLLTLFLFTLLILAIYYMVPT